MKEMTEEYIKQCVSVLHNGGVVLYPTDTVWGLGCDATNENAVQRIFEIKRRAESKSLILLVDSMAQVAAYVEQIPEIAYDLTEIADKPLTIIYPAARNIAKNILAADGSVGIRITGESFSKSLCERLRKPIVSTSANISGENAPRNFAEIAQEIKNSVDYIVPFRQNEMTTATPSAIMKLEKNGVFQLIRK